MSTAKSGLKAVKGMNDVLPGDSEVWQQIERICAAVFEQFSYRQIRTPIVESTHLFARSIGADTDIVAKEMYTFADRNGESITLRPEGTASTVRAGIQHGLFYHQQQRLWYSGPMFRYERPQKGRYRQFHQLGLEAYGWPGPDIEAEVLSLTHTLFARLGLQNTRLQINSLGDDLSRSRFRAALTAFLADHKGELDSDSQRRLDTNPLRILDSKNEKTQAILRDAPAIPEYLSDVSNAHFQQLQEYLNVLEIPFDVNTKLVRGLDYYNDTVFEWVNQGFGAQSAVCGGGRYDAMVEQLGGQSTPAFGFGLGFERLVQMLLEQSGHALSADNGPQIFVVSTQGPARQHALSLQAKLIEAGCRVHCFMGEGSFKSQFKKADKSGAAVALVLGQEEIEQGHVSLKMLRRQAAAPSQAQTRVANNELIDVVTNLLKTL